MLRNSCLVVFDRLRFLSIIGLLSFSLSISLLDKKEETRFLFSPLFSVSYYDYFLFPILFRDKWFRCGAVLSYAEKYHYETDKQSGIVLRLFFYSKHYRYFFITSIISMFNVLLHSAQCLLMFNVIT